MKKFCKEAFLEDLGKTKSLDLLKHNSVDEMFKRFQNKFVEIVDKNAPYKRLSNRERKLKQNPWITKSILQSVKMKNKRYNNYIKKQDTFWYERYKFYQSKVTMLISKRKRNHLRAFFQENLNNSKKLWNKVKELVNKKQKEIDDIFLVAIMHKTWKKTSEESVISFKTTLKT